jgi:formylglycine-generating enzyme required for sulfatase activity
MRGDQGAAEIKKQLDSVDIAIEAIRAAGSTPPESLLTERFQLARDLERLDQVLVAPEETAAKRTRRNVFVIMPFRDPFNSYYTSVIRPAADDAGFDVSRSDEVYSVGAFVQTIWSQILDADAVIAEMTGANANVLYELGLCHAIDRKVIMITQNMQDVPSDLRHMNCVLYDTAQVNWTDRLRNSIQKMLLFDRGQTRNTILYPAASVDNTNLFERMETRIRELTSEGRQRENQALAWRSALDSAVDERNQLRTAVANRVRKASSGESILSSTDGDLQVARISVPEGECGPLEFVHIPEGPFIFGRSANASDEWLAGYWISRHSITNAQYCAFLNSVGLGREHDVFWIDLTGASPVDKCRIARDGRRFVVEPGYEDFPVTFVNYYGAAAFCDWVGGSLPSAEQWEKAARGVDGREYPWGSSPPAPAVANISTDGWARDVAPIDVRSKKEGMSPFGMIQPIGNVWHWTSTYYPDRNVQAVRGGSFYDFRLGRREVYRFVVHPDGPDFSQGFVVAKRLFLKSARPDDDVEDA